MNADMLTRQIANADAYAPEFDLPEAARRADVAFADISRRIDMDAKEITRPVETEPRRRQPGWLIAATAFGVVVVLVGGLVLLNRGNEPEIPPANDSTTTSAPETTTTAPTTTTIAAPAVDSDALAFAEEFAAELNNGDYAAAADRVTSATVLEDLGGNGTEERLRVRYELWVILESVIEVNDCATGSSGITTCTLVRTSAREQITAEKPERWYLRFKIVDGALTYFDQPFVSTDVYWFEREGMELWFQLNYPDVYAKAYFSPTDAEVAAQLREEYVPIWIAAGRPRG